MIRAGRGLGSKGDAVVAKNILVRGVAAMALAFAGVSAASADPTAPPLAMEDSDTAVMPAPMPHWGYVSTSWDGPGTRIFDPDSGKMVGMVHQATLADFAIDPLGRYYYVAESIWTLGNRGTRQDMVTVYDARTLKIVKEIAIPGRLLVGGRRYNLSISPDGHTGYVYNMDPASTVVVVDLDKGRTVQSIETPGCGIAAALPANKLMSLCADGSVAVTTLGHGKPVTVRSAPFFSAEDDPVFDGSPIDATTGKATLLTYTGLVYSMTPGTSLDPGTPWSVQEAAGVPRGLTKPLVVNWLPSGSQPAAVHIASNRLFVLMHMGEYWSHKEQATELWVLDLGTHKLLSRHKLEVPAMSVQVSQDAQPLVYLNGKDGKLVVLDGTTFEQKKKFDDVGNGVLTTIAMARP